MDNPSTLRAYTPLRRLWMHPCCSPQCCQSTLRRSSMAAQRLPPFCLGAHRRRPRSNRGTMTIPEKRTRSGGLAVASWRDISSEDREDSVSKDIARRLMRTCKDLSVVEFRALVAKMTSEQLRGERNLQRVIPRN